MASDEIVWQVINQQFCSYKLKTSKAQTFCRNEYNVTGLCSRQACPLANSQYATIRANPETGVMYLFMKTIERSHMPSKWWERIRLSNNYAKALEQIDERLQYWPKFLSHKCKQRLTRLRQVALQTKRIAREEERLGEKVVQRMAPKIRRREEGRERKAEAAARIERQIEKELIERLRSGAYGDRPLNVEEGIWKKVLIGLERGGEMSRDRDLDQDAEEEQELEKEFEDGDVEYVSDIEGESEDDASLGDMEDWLDGNSSDEDSGEDNDSENSDDGNGSSDSPSEEEEPDEADERKLQKTTAALKRKRPTQPPLRPAKKKGTKGPRREIEYEIENEPPTRQTIYA